MAYALVWNIWKAITPPIPSLPLGQDKDIIRLVVGYHQLEGKRISLKKPFVILEKVGKHNHDDVHNSTVELTV